MFTPINTQEEFDAAINERIGRVKAKFADYEDIKSQLSSLIAEKESHQATLDALNANVHSLETQLAEANNKARAGELKGLRMAAAVNNGLPITLADRIGGEDESSIDNDAKMLASIFGHSHQAPPLASNEPGVDTKDAAYKKLAAAFE